MGHEKGQACNLTSVSGCLTWTATFATSVNSAHLQLENIVRPVMVLSVLDAQIFFFSLSLSTITI